MKLKDALINHSGERVKIGAQSSYIFCGTLDESISEVFEKHDKVEVRRLQKILNDTRRHDEKFDSIWNTKTEMELKTFHTAARKYRWNNDMILKKHSELIKRIEQRKKNDRMRVDKLLEALPQRIENYVGIADREVKEEYESLEGGTIIIFDGMEVGAYWTYDEYEERNK